MKVKYLKLAKIEFDDAIRFYNTQQTDLGKEFQLDIKNSILKIKEFPYAYTEIKYGIRKCLLYKFNHTVLYALKENYILIIAISHQHRKPDYWVNRIK